MLRARVAGVFSELVEQECAQSSWSRSVLRARGVGVFSELVEQECAQSSWSRSVLRAREAGLFSELVLLLGDYKNIPGKMRRVNQYSCIAVLSSWYTSCATNGTLAVPLMLH